MVGERWSGAAANIVDAQRIVDEGDGAARNRGAVARQEVLSEVVKLVSDDSEGVHDGEHQQKGLAEGLNGRGDRLEDLHPASRKDLGEG